MTDLNARWNFGVGCFAFEYFDQPRSFSLGEWGEAIRAGLESLPTVDGVLIEIEQPDGTFTRSGEVVRAPMTSAGAYLTREFLPDVPGMSVEFMLSIPRRLHKDLASRSFPVGELFRVHVEYLYDGPVAFVVCMDDDPASPQFDGTQAVILVREFLQDALTKAGSAVGLSSTGPSPFHAKFSAAAGTGMKPLEWSEGHRVGYRDIAIEYSTAQFAGPDEAWDEIRYSLGDEFSVYYKLIRMRERRIHNSRLVFEKTESLIAASSASGIRGGLARIFGTSRDARTLGLLALQSRLMAASDRSFAESQIQTISKQTSALDVAGEELQETADDHLDDAIANALAMVSFLEGGRSREFEATIVAASTLLGAASGAVAALIAG